MFETAFLGVLYSKNNITIQDVLELKRMRLFDSIVSKYSLGGK